MPDSGRKSVSFDPNCYFLPRADVVEDGETDITRTPDVTKALSPVDDLHSRCMLGSPMASPKLLMSCGSPNFIRRASAAPLEQISETTCSSGKEDEVDGPTTACLDASFQLNGSPNTPDDIGRILLSVNVGEPDNSATCSGTDFENDSFFIGGEVVRTEEKIGDGEGMSLYQTARTGNFYYNFHNLEPGNYLVDLHFAEIVFTYGPRGIRTFDVFIQGEKVISCLDIFAQVGSNQPLVVPDLKATVFGKEGLTIRFEGVNESPLVCGISVRKGSSTWTASLNKSVDRSGQFQFSELEISEDGCNDCKKLKYKYDLLLNAQLETSKGLEDAKKEIDLKSKECHEAWMSLHELQMELMRKSMHVGSLAYAVEGQVKEKSRWFAAVRELSQRIKILKTEHAKLLEDVADYRKCIQDMATMTTTIQSAVVDSAVLLKEHEDLKQKFTKEAKCRKDLYNKVLELKGNIRVFCRCRPLNSDEMSKGVPMVVDFESAKEGEITVKAQGGARKVFKFDSVFVPEADQDAVFEDTSPLATSVLDGYNVCIFAYGQTGTGKTFTMEGTKDARGVNYKTLQELFRIINERQALVKYEMSVSVLEVYNEQIRDLLASESHSAIGSKRLEIRQVADGAHHIPGLVEANVSNMNEVWEVLKTGSNARAVGATNANEHSSRSHCIYCVMVKGENLITGECTRSKLWLIDLAGSERLAKTDAQGDRLKEAQNINKSLSALGDVISALATKSPHIPFRNSKLTHLLQDSLGGDSKALMFVQISPSENDVSETLCSLNFASRVRGVELGAAKKQFDSNEINKQKQMLEKAKQEMKSKDTYIKRLEESVSCTELKVKTKEIEKKNLQDRIKELESQLLIERKLARQHIDTKIAENHNQQQKLKQQDKHRRESIAAPIKPLVENQCLREEPDFGEVKSLVTTNPCVREDSAPAFREVKSLVSNQCVREEPAPLAFREISNLMSAAIPENNVSKVNTNQPVHGNLPREFSPLKENRPSSAYESTRKASRLSLCPYARDSPPVIPAARRSSLIPFPASVAAAAAAAPTTSPKLEAAAGPTSPLPDNFDAEQRAPSYFPMSGAKTDEPKTTKKSISIMRRSLQKKVIVMPKMQQQQQQQARRIGSGLYTGVKEIKPRRTVAGRAGANHPIDSKKQKERGWNQKERGWNHGTAVRNVI